MEICERLVTHFTTMCVCDKNKGACSTSRVSEYTNITVTVSYRNNNRSRGRCYLYPSATPARGLKIYTRSRALLSRISESRFRIIGKR